MCTAHAAAEPNFAEEWVGVYVCKNGAHVITWPHDAIPRHACSTGDPTTCWPKCLTWIQLHTSRSSLFVLDLASHYGNLFLHPAASLPTASNRQQCSVCSLPRNAGFASERGISYWLSFDPDSRMLKYGMGHHMEETTLLSCALPDGLGSLYHTCPKLVCLHGYDGPVQQRSLYEAKLSSLGGQRQVCPPRRSQQVQQSAPDSKSAAS